MSADTIALLWGNHCHGMLLRQAAYWRRAGDYARARQAHAHLRTLTTRHPWRLLP